MYRGLLSFMAMNCGVVVFNVDYRLAPEYRFGRDKTPILDFLT